MQTLDPVRIPRQPRRPSMAAKQRSKSGGMTMDRFLLLVADLLWILSQLIIVFFMIYLFLLAVSLLMRACRIYTDTAVGESIKNNKFLKNPVGASVIGILGTILLQSSTTVMALSIALLPAGVLSMDQSINVMLGTQVGKSITDVIGSLIHDSKKHSFTNIYTATILIDVINYLGYLMFVPVETVYTPFEELTGMMIAPLTNRTDITTLRWITEPVVNRFIMKAVSVIASDKRELFIEQCLDPQTLEPFAFCPFERHMHTINWRDHLLIGVFFIIFVVLISISQLVIVIVFYHMFTRRIAGSLLKILKPKRSCCKRYLVDFGMTLFGVIAFPITMTTPCTSPAADRLVELSDIEISKLIPLLMGANVGSTLGGVVAALAAPSKDFYLCLQTSLSQTLFNVICFLIFYPVPCLTAIPLSIAYKIGEKTAKYRWIAFLYSLVVFLLVLFTALVSAFLPFEVSIVLFLVLAVVVMGIAAITLVQRNFPKYLPPALRTWGFLPLWMHSLRPYDNVLQRLSDRVKCLQWFTRWHYTKEERYIKQAGYLVSSV